MAYWMDVWEFPNSNEYEFKWAGKYGAKGEKRAKKKKATPEQIKEQNQRNKEKKVRRLIKANFLPGDIWGTLKYPAGTRIPIERVEKDLKNFWDKMRRLRSKKGEVLKFIYRLEIGQQGGIHIHILINDTNKKPKAMDEIKKAWGRRPENCTTIDENGGYKKLAEYIVKQPEEVMEQLSLFPMEERKKLCKYSSSRNLIRPEPRRVFYRRRIVRKLIEEGPKPTPGYYINKESVHSGKNIYTGMSYLHYTEVRIKEIHSGIPPERGEEWNSG